ncbi:MAG: hypothetical protein II123_00200 [Lachnospiraceae bacterium]|nr:hypothetical protein [Lachnospiraceae bacterium]
MERRVQIKCLAILAIIVMCMGIGYQLAFTFARSHMKGLDVSGMAIGNKEYMCGVDEITEFDKNYVRIKGWVAHLGHVVERYNVHFVLKDLSTNRFYELPSYLEQRDDVNELVSAKDGVNHQMSGLVATVRKSELKGKYHIYIEYQNDGENVLVDTVEEQEWNE